MLLQAMVAMDVYRFTVKSLFHSVDQTEEMADAAEISFLS
jgi:hypothetical protein